VDLCKLAGLAPAAVICEIIKDDGSMARRDDLRKFSRQHGIPIVYISDFVEYRLANEQLVEKVDESTVEFRGVQVEKILYRDHLHRTHTVLRFYKIHEIENVRFQNIGSDLDLLLDEKRFLALERSIDYLKHNGGLLIFLDSQIISKEQAKEFGIGAQILKDLGVRSIRLLTTNVETEFVGLGGFGLDVTEKIDVG
jgi:3,4-dihydroxy 2-butanone 4-phosphate synthase/GTP cyclohydrolase II